MTEPFLVAPNEVATRLGVPRCTVPHLGMPQIVLGRSVVRYRTEDLHRVDPEKVAAAKRCPPDVAVGWPTMLVLADLDNLLLPSIYGLVDPKEQERVRYVGLATVPVSRYLGHINAGSVAIGRWVKSLRRKRRHPIMIQLELVVDLDPVARLEREREWIRYYRDRNQADLNVMGGS